MLLALVLGANPYPGIAEPDYGLINTLKNFFIGFGVLLLIIRVFSGLQKRANAKKGHWALFQQMAKARGLSKEQIKILGSIAKSAKVKRPARLLGSLRLYDRAVEKALEKEGFDAHKAIITDSIRSKLSTSKANWSKSDGERRQVSRVGCSWNARLELVSFEALIKKEDQRIEEADEDQLLKIAHMHVEAGNFLPHRVQIADISSGGVALLASPKFTGSTGDIARFTGDSERIPFSINGLFAKINSIEKDDQRGLLVLHMKFLPIDAEIRKSIIQYVYDKVDADQSTVKRGKPKVSKHLLPKRLAT